MSRFLSQQKMSIISSEYSWSQSTLFRHDLAHVINNLTKFEIDLIVTNDLKLLLSANAWHHCNLEMWLRSLKVTWLGTAQDVLTLHKIWHLSSLWWKKKSTLKVLPCLASKNEQSNVFSCESKKEPLVKESHRKSYILYTSSRFATLTAGRVSVACWWIESRPSRITGSNSKNCNTQNRTLVLNHSGSSSLGPAGLNLTVLVKMMPLANAINFLTFLPSYFCIVHFVG